MEARLQVNRRALVLVICAFLLTRGFLLWQVDSSLYRSASVPDVLKYELWADSVGMDGKPAYSEVPIEYPPGSLPFIMAPQPTDDYRTGFIFMMLIVDALGLVGLLRIGRRTGASTGPFVWILGLLLLGPLAYIRLDLVPAVATIWAIERALAGAWIGSGLMWGFGIAAKLYPLVLVPAALLRAARRRALAIGISVAIAVSLLPFSSALPDLVREVIGYHSERGVQIESTWGAISLLLHRGDNALVVGAGSIETNWSFAQTVFHTVGLALSLAALAWGTWTIRRRVATADTGRLAVGLYGLLALLLGVGTVLSPQFIIWLIALGAAAASFELPAFRRPLLAVLPIAVATQLIYPVMYEGLKARDLLPALILLARDLSLIVIGLWVLLTLRRQGAANEQLSFENTCLSGSFGTGTTGTTREACFPERPRRKCSPSSRFLNFTVVRSPGCRSHRTT